MGTKLPNPEIDRFTLALRLVSLRKVLSRDEKKLKLEPFGLNCSTTPLRIIMLYDSLDDSMLCLLLEGVKCDALSIFSRLSSS